MRWSMVVILFTLAAYGLVKSDAQGTIADGPSENFLHSFSVFFQDKDSVPEPDERRRVSLQDTTLVPMRPGSLSASHSNRLAPSSATNLTPGPQDSEAWTAKSDLDG